jgi:hypothetical protein
MCCASLGPVGKQHVSRFYYSHVGSAKRDSVADDLLCRLCCAHSYSPSHETLGRSSLHLATRREVI